MSNIIVLRLAPRPRMQSGLGAAGQAAWNAEMAKDRYRRLDPFQVEAIRSVARVADRIAELELLAGDPEADATLASMRDVLGELHDFLAETRRQPEFPLEGDGIDLPVYGA